MSSPTPATPPAAPETSKPQRALIVQHRYPFRPSEIATITVLGAAGVLGGLAGAPWWTAVAAVAAAAGLWRTASRRKARSAVTVRVDASALVVTSRGRLGDSRADLSGEVSVSARQMGPETVLLVHDGAAAARVPMRAVEASGALRAALLTASQAGGGAASPDARHLLRHAHESA